MNPLKYWLAPVLGVGAMLTTLLTWQQPANAATPGFDGALTVTTANQIINQYADLTAIDTAAKSITVDNIANLSSGAPVNGGALVTGDLLMLYQAQGASINTTDTASYGNVTAYNNSGQYQFVTVGSITGNTITLASECGVLISFDPIYAQVVRVPQLSSLTVSGTGSITAPAWNGTTGGIVVADVSGATTLSSAGAINVNAKGFRGAAPDTNAATTGAGAGVETGYRFNTDATSTAKGEGIAGPTASLTNGAYGRGAPANGGGGGNGHNGGGGGGSNGGVLSGWNGTGSKSVATANWANAWNLESAGFATNVSPGGGRGGYTYFASNQDALTLAPGAAAWGGDQRDNVGGFGGRPLDTTGNRAFLGGGGGAGEWNGGAAAAANGGGNGGGLVYLTTGSLAGTGSILANGGVGGNSGATDSASGGGGGGAILIESPTTAPAGLNLTANGGAGGSQTANNNAEGEGPGGGGGGGYIAVSGGTKTANGGANGTSVSSLITEFTPNGATMGTAGTTTATLPTAGSLSCYTPRIGIAKEIGTPTVSSADNSTYDIPYTIRLSSYGEDLTGVTVTDDLASTFPGATINITADPTLSAISTGSALTLNDAATFLSSGTLVTTGNLVRQTNGADATATIIFTVRVRPVAGTTSNTVFSNSATTSGTFTPPSGALVVVSDTSDSGTSPDTNGNRNGNEAGENDPTTNTMPVADLSLSKTGPASANFGSNIVFTLTVSNAAGSSTATGVQVRDQLPSGYTYVSDDGAGAYNSATGVWSVADIAAATTAQLQITVTVNSSGVYANTAQVSASGLPDPDSLPNNSSATDDDQASLSPTMSDPIGSSFPCDGTFYQVRSSGTNTALLKFSGLAGGSTASSVWSAIGTPGLNGLAFNRSDGFLYAFRTGVAASSRDIYKLGDVGSLLVGTVVYATGGAYDLTNSFVITGGTFDSAGRFYFIGQGGGNLVPNAIYRVDSFADSDLGTAGVQIAVAQVYTFTGTIENVGDFAFGPDGNLYGATNANLYQFALGAGTATVTQKTIPGVTGIGSAYFDSNYTFYVYANGTQTLYEVNFSFGSSFATDPATSSVSGSIPYSGALVMPSGSSDGASCALPSNNLAGTVWDDRNGNVLIDGTPVETGTNAGGLYVYAVNSSGNVVAKNSVAANGAYTLYGLTAGSYTLRLSTNATPAIGDAAPVASSQSTGWVNTGERNTTGPETVTPGDIAVTIAGSDLNNLDFGIEQTPTANAVNASSQTNPGGGTLVTVPNLGGSDPEDGALGTGSTIIISSLATNGTLYYNGIALTLGQVITGYDPSLLRVDPDNGTVTLSFTYAVRDAAGNDSATATVSMPFTNEPPVASDVTNPSIAVNAAATSIDALQATDPDDGVASYTVLTLPNAAYGILYLADGTTAVTAGQVLTLAQASSLKFDPSGTFVGSASFTFTATDFNGASDASAATFTIPIGNNPPSANDVTTSSIASTAAATAIDPLFATDTDGTVFSYTVSSLPPATQGTLFMNDGTTAVTLGQILTPAEASSLKFDPSGTYTGNVTFTHTATDNNGAVDATPATYTIPVGNNPPVATDVTNAPLSVGEGSTPISSLAAADTDGTISSYNVSTLPPAAQGMLYLADGTTAVTLGQVLTPAQAGSLKFDPSGNFAGNVTFTFTATDNDTAVDATPATFTIPVTNVPPVATDVTTLSIPSTAAATTIDPLAATESDGVISSYTVSSLPPAAQGTLFLADGTTTVTLGQVLTPGQASSLKFDPSGTYTGDVTFTFTATDNTSAVDASPATYTIPVGNNPPVATNATNASIASTAAATTISALAATDTDGMIFSYTVSSLPLAAQGTLYLADGTTAVTLGQVLTPAQASSLKFDPSGSFTGNVTFTFTATDNNGLVDATPATYTIPVGNNPPTATDVNNPNVSIGAGPTAISSLAATDTDGTISSYTVSSLPPAVHGILFLADGTTAVTAGPILTPAQASSLRFDPSGTFAGNVTFTFTATDNDAAIDATPATFTIPIVNNPPVASDVTNASIPSSAAATTIDPLAATDADGSIFSFTVVTLPPASEGILYLANGTTTVSVGQVLTPAQASSLKFDPVGTFTGSSTFNFTATDNLGLVDATSATFTIPVGNTPPVATDVTTSSIASSAAATTIDPLLATDSDGTIASFTISSLPPVAQGILYLADGTTAVTVGQALTPAQASSLKFDPSGTTSGDVTFTFTATDNNGAVDSSPATYTIPVTNVPPVATNVTTSSITSTAAATAINPLAATDSDGTVASYTVSTLPPAAQGTLFLADGTTAIMLGQVLTPAQASSLKFDPSGSFTGNVTFTFTATDNDAAIDASPATYTVPVGNNPPTASDVTNVAVSVGAGPTTLTTGLAATDTDGTIASYTISSLPPAVQGILFLADGTTAITAGQVLTLAQAAGLTFDPSGTFSGNVTFTYTATDNLSLVDGTPATYTIPVTNVSPVAADVTTSSIPSSAAATTIDPLAASDADGTIATYTVVTLPPASEGILYLADGTTAVTTGQVLTPAQASSLKFDPIGTFTGVSNFTVTATDNLGLVDASPALYSIPVGNNPPVAQTITNSSLSVAAGPTTLATGLAATDADGTIATYTVLTLPPVAQGTLFLADGVTAVTTGQVLTPAQAAGLKFDPSGNFAGNVAFTYTATDNAGLTDASAAIYAIPLTNTPPVATNVTTSSIASSAGPTAIDPLAATDSDGTVASYTVVLLPPAAQGILYLANGTTPVSAGQVLTPAQASSLKFDPSGTFVGNVNFTFTATDNLGVVDSSAATYTIPVGNVPPVPNDVTNPAISVSAGPTAILGLDATDSDGTISSFTVVNLPTAAQGTLFLEDGVTAVTAGQILTPAQAASLKFDPSGTFSGNVSFTFNATDNDSATGSSPATFNIPLGNNPPVANSDTNASILSSAGATAINALTATDSDGTVVSYTVVTLPLASAGVLYLADGTTAVTAGQVLTPAQAATLKFDPNPAFTGNTTFNFTAIDNTGTTDPSAATITIPVGNNPPVANDVNSSAMPSSAGPTAVTALNGTDTDGTISNFTISSLPPAAQGTLLMPDGVTPVTAGQVLTPAEATNLKFDPSGSFNGNVTFTYTTTDNLGLTDPTPATVTIPVTNMPPVANNVTNATLPGSAGPTTISSLDATDADGIITSYTVVTLPPAAQGTLFLADGVTAVTAGQALTPAQASSLKFDPNGTFSGNVTFTFTATDNSGAPDTTPATFTIPVGNNPPVATYVTAPSMLSSAGPTTIPALAATDTDGTIVSYTVSSLPTAAQGVLYLADGVTPVTLEQILTPAQAAGLKFDPAPSFSGNATFTFTATDNNNTVDPTPATVTIPVGNVPPTATPVVAPSIFSSAGPTALPPLTGTDPDGTVSSITITTLPPASQGVLTLNGNPVTVGQVLTPAEAANLKFDPSPTFSGDASFKFTVTDDTGSTSSPATVTIPVIAPPTVAKTFASSTVAADGTVGMSITITNPNSSAMNGVAFTDSFPAGLEIASAPTVSQCGGTVSSTATSISLSAGTIAANSSCTITASVKPTKIGAITNTLPTGAVTTTNAGSSPAPASATLETASVGVAKTASVVNNGDGTYSITYLINVANLGSVPLSNVQAVENFENTFTGAATWTIQNAPSIVSGAGLTLNPGFTGRVAGSTNLLNAGSSSLDVGAASTVSVTVRVNPNGNPATTAYNNQVVITATGNGPGGATPAVSDLSSNSGTNPDPNGNGNPNEPGESDPTGVSFSENPSIGVAKQAGALTSNGNGTYTQAFTVIVRNYGDVPLSNFTVTENLSSVFGTALVNTSNLSVTGAAGLSANAGFNGNAQTNLAATGSTLAVGATATFTFDVTIRPSATALSFTNTVTARGSSPSGSIIADDSINGLDPNPTSGSPNNDTSGTPIVFAKITGHVFSDINGDGTQQTGEPNLNANTVTVTPVSGPAFTVLTDTNGDYTAIVPAGNTKLEATAPTGNLVTTANNPQNINAVAGTTASTPVGFQPKGTIKGHVWTDLNAGGSQQAGEPNANGLTVTINDSSGATQTILTDANGDYIATVPFGPVTATVTLPPGSRLTTANNPQTITITDTSIQTLSPVGYHQDGLISGVIFEDLDGNGVQDVGENGLPGIPVKITDSTGKVFTVITDATGAYSQAVPAGSTTIEVVTPGGTLLTTANGTQNVTAVSKTLTKAAKIGFQPQNKVVGHIFNDPNGNGIQDSGETNIANQDVNVTNSSGAVQTVKTNATGDYVAFVIPGKTTINVVDPTGSSLTTANDPQAVTVLGGQTSTATPVGFQARGTLSGHLFNDVNGDGVQGAGEPNLPGLTVTITDANGQIITLISDANGDYTTNVPAGSTTVSVTGPNGTTVTTANNPQTVTVPVGGNVSPTPIGFNTPVAPTGSLTGRIFNDTNGNGALDADEKGIASVRVTVTDSNQQVFTVITDQDGNYTVPSLAAGRANVIVTNPDGLALTTGNNGILNQPGQNVDVTASSSVTVPDVGYVKPSLQLTKRVLSPQVSIGDVLEYELGITNSSPIDVRDVLVIDELPFGLAYKPGSSKVAGTKLEPVAKTQNGRVVLTWTVPGIMTPNANVLIQFATIVTPNAPQKLDNIATAKATAGDSNSTAEALTVQAQSAVATTKIVQAGFNNKSVFVGRVYFDRDTDANFTSGIDKPLAGARVYLSDGRYAITDAQGRYSVPDITPGVYVVRLDRLTAPYTPVRVPTDVGLPGTRRVDAQGGLYEANFPLFEPDASVDKERETMVERGSVKLEKTLERTFQIQSDRLTDVGPKDGYVIRETITISKTIANLTITDPLPPGATRGTTLLVGSDGKEITVKLLEDGRIQIPGKLEAGTYTLVYVIYTNLTPDQVVTDPSINYDEVIR